MEKITVWVLDGQWFHCLVEGAKQRTVDRAMYDWLTDHGACAEGKSWAMLNCDNLEHMWDTLVESGSLAWLAWVAWHAGVNCRGQKYTAVRFMSMSNDELKELNPWRK